jgi:hypothetical protein
MRFWRTPRTRLGKAKLGCYLLALPLVGLVTLESLKASPSEDFRSQCMDGLLSVLAVHLGVSQLSEPKE